MSTVQLDEIIVVSMIVRVVQTTTRTDSKAAIIADVRATLGELKCLGSERLVRLGISMTQLHVMHMLERHGELPMSRLAEMLDVSMSATTGLVDRVEERGFVERIRVPEDRRVVLARITDAGRQMLDDVELVRTELMERVLDELDEGQMAGVASAVASIRSALETAASDPTSGISHTHESLGGH
jgi:DNA-binding MarR family transcriptional regulator